MAQPHRERSTSACHRVEAASGRPTVLLPWGQLVRLSAVLARPDRDPRRHRPVHPEPARLRRLRDGGRGRHGPRPDRHLRRRSSGSSSSRRSATISDYTVSRWGRRKPYIVIGSLLDVVFLVGHGDVEHGPRLAAFVALLAFSTNIARGPFQGYVPDLVAGAAGRHGQLARRAHADPRQHHRDRRSSTIALAIERDRPRDRSPSPSSSS